MARVLVYTGPSEGHLYPVVATMLELRRRGHDVVVRTLSGEVERLRSLGLDAAPVDPAVATREADDWRARTPVGALRRRVQQFADRAPAELADLDEAIASSDPDVLLVDPTSWGAAVAAEASPLPFAFFAHSPLPIASRDAPPFGLGLAPLAGVAGSLRDRAVERVLLRPLERIAIPKLNRLRAGRGLRPLRDSTDFALSADRFLYYSAEPFEYPRSDWPDSVRLVGPGLWEPAGEEPKWLAELPRPLVLVTCSTEFQGDTRIITAAIDAFDGDDVGVVVTTGAVEPPRRPRAANVRLERFVPHTPVIRRASCVVCHAGMGITQKALAAGVPVVAVPFGRDQPEVARRVCVAGAGTMVRPGKLDGERLRRAVAEATSMKAGAERIATAFAAAGGPTRAADEVEELASTRGSA